MEALSLFEDDTELISSLDQQVGAIAAVPEPRASLTEEDVRALCQAAQYLADSQIPDEQDYVGFNNSDVLIGRSLAAAVANGYANEAQVRYLALMVAQKYRRQSAPILGPGRMETLLAYGKDAPDRDLVKRDLKAPLIVKRHDDGTFFVEAEHRHNYFLKGLSARREATGARSVSRLIFSDAASCSEFIKRVTQNDRSTRLVGDLPTDAEIARDMEHLGPKIQVERMGESQFKLIFDYDKTLVSAVQALPSRRFDASHPKGWVIPVAHAGLAMVALQTAGVDVAPLKAAFPDVAPPTDLRVEVAFVIKGERISFPGLPYDAGLTEAFKCIPSQRWDPLAKVRSIDVYDLPHILPAFQRLASKFNFEKLAAYRPPTLAKDTVAKLPPEKLAVLFDYQREGVEFLMRPLDDLRASTPGGKSIRGIVVGDEMGLGKSVQSALASHGITAEDSRIVIVCPASLKLNWRKEIKKFVGSEQTVCVVNGKKGIDHDARWVVINYDLLAKYYDELKGLKYDALILDEAHYVKNPKALRSIYTVGGMLPVPETEEEKKTRLALEARFGRKVKTQRKKIRVPGLCEFARNRVFPMTGSPIPNKFKDSFNLWRAIGHPVAANKHKFEERYCGGHDIDIGYGRTAWSADAATNIGELRDLVRPVFLQRKKADVLGQLPPKTRRFMPVDIDTKKYDAVVKEYAERSDVTETRCALEFLTEQRMATAIAKIPATADFLLNCVDQGEKIILFSKSTRVLDALQKELPDIGVRLDGSMNQTARQKAVDDFQERSDIRIFLGQIDAAGVGITLTAANHVVFNDFSYVPGEHAQAEDRAHRIGQTQNLSVTYIVAEGTIDDDICELLEQKLAISTEFEETDNSLFNDMKKRVERRLGKFSISYETIEAPAPRIGYPALA